MKRTTRTTMGACLALAAATVVASLAGTASAVAQVAPVNTALPTISGTAAVGQMLTADNGTWQNSPTAYQYRWLRCDRNGNGCGPIAGATQKTYTLVAADADNTMRVRVTAVNADGAADARSAQTQVVQPSTTAAPRNTSRPSVTGDTTVGQELTADNGTWTNNPTSYAYQWRRCDTSPFQCLDVNGATGKTYGVREADIGFRMDVVVTASNAKGNGTARSLLTAVIEPKARVVNQSAEHENRLGSVRRPSCVRTVPGLRRLAQEPDDPPDRRAARAVVLHAALLDAGRAEAVWCVHA